MFSPQSSSADNNLSAVTNAFVIMGIVIAIYAILAYNLFSAT
jgi:hypothetical protein